MATVRKAFKTLDAFPKVDDSYVARSGVGGVATAIVAALLTLLVVYEVNTYVDSELVYEYFIDASTQAPLLMNLDLTVGLECKYVQTLLYDHTGSVSADIRNLVSFQDDELNTFLAGANHPVAYSNLVHKSVAEHIRVATQKLKVPLQRGLPAGAENTPPPLKACRLFGIIPLKRVAGRLQIMAAGHGQGNIHTPHEALNFTHIIHKMSFGQDFPGIVNPLDNKYELAVEHFHMFQYFISVVPTTYVDTNGNALLTNQYAVTEYNRVVDHEKGSHGIPGLNFKFDIEPLLVRITNRKRSILHLLTRLSGVVGGVFVCFGLLTSALTSLSSFIAASGKS